MSEEDIFEKLEKEASQTLYKNQRIFTEDYAPESTKDVLFREEEIAKIAKVIFNTAERARSDLFIFGVAGIGKTYTVKAVLSDASKKWGNKFKSVWVNCKNIRPLTEFQIMNEISEQLGKKFEKGYATKDIERYIRP